MFARNEQEVGSDEFSQKCRQIFPTSLSFFGTNQLSHTQTHANTHRHRHRHTPTHTDTQTHRYTHRHRHIAHNCHHLHDKPAIRYFDIDTR